MDVFELLERIIEAFGSCVPSSILIMHLHTAYLESA